MVDPAVIFVVLIAALVAALTPSTTSVFIQLTASILGGGGATRRVLWLGVLFVLALFTASFAMSFVGLWAFHVLPQAPANFVAIGVGTLIVAAGLVEIKNYFWYGHGFGLKIHTSSVRRIKKLTKGTINPLRATALGIYTAFAALPSVSPPLLAVVTLLRNDVSIESFELLALYNSIFVLPLLGVLLLAVGGTKVSAIQRWKEDSKSGMRLGVGLLIIVLGWVLILIANGALNFG